MACENEEDSESSDEDEEEDNSVTRKRKKTPANLKLMATTVKEVTQKKRSSTNFDKDYVVQVTEPYFEQFSKQVKSAYNKVN